MKQRASRFMASLPGILHTPAGDHPCEALNLNRAGVLLVVSTLTTWSPGTTRITVKSVGGDLVLTLVATAARVTALPEGGIEVGIAFPELVLMTEADRGRLEALVARVVEGTSHGALESLTAGSTPAEIRAALDKIPVAHRISMAGRAMSQERSYLKHDDNPKVLEALARNPNNNLVEIKALVRLPTHLPTTLDWIARDRRWQKDDELKVMLATHPRITLQIAERVLDSMDARTKQKALQTPGLPPALRAKLLATRNLRGS